MKKSIRKENDEVLYSTDEIVTLNKTILDELKSMALKNPRTRIRLCTHKDPKDSLHEMFIIHAKECYVRPHRHIAKIESFAVLEGEADAVFFNNDGSVRNVLALGEIGSGKQFYYRIADPIYHSLVIKSEFLVFHEVTEGPFVRNKTEFPIWAPDREDESKEYLDLLKIKIENFG
jgi:cupin fold WbuC family metalloprotein